MQGLHPFCSLVGFALLLNACSGVEIVAPPTASPADQNAQASGVATPADQTTQTAAPAISQTPMQPSVVPSPTIPPTTSPLPSPTDRSADATITTSATVAPAGPTVAIEPSPTVAAAEPTATLLPVTLDPEGTIVWIRQRYNIIKGALAGYRRTEQDLEGFSTEGGTLEAFYDGDELRKLVATYFGESGRATEEYYFWDNQIIFVFRSDNTYDRPFGSIVQTAEDRYYFAENTMIRWIDPNQRQVPDTDPTFAEREAQVQQQKQELLALLSS